MLALVVGIGLGVLGDRLLASPGLGPPVAGRGTLETLPTGPVRVVAETVRLGRGFRSRHRHGGPTFNLVRSGEVEVESRRYRAGELFFEPGGRVHSITVLRAARLDVVRLLPPGAPPTSEEAP